MYFATLTRLRNTRLRMGSAQDSPVIPSDRSILALRNYCGECELGEPILNVIEIRTDEFRCVAMAGGVTVSARAQREIDARRAGAARLLAALCGKAMYLDNSENYVLQLEDDDDLIAMDEADDDPDLLDNIFAMLYEDVDDEPEDADLEEEQERELQREALMHEMEQPQEIDVNQREANQQHEMEQQLEQQSRNNLEQFEIERTYKTLIELGIARCNVNECHDHELMQFQTFFPQSSVFDPEAVNLAIKLEQLNCVYGNAELQNKRKLGTPPSTAPETPPPSPPSHTLSEASSPSVSSFVQYDESILSIPSAYVRNPKFVVNREIANGQIRKVRCFQPCDDLTLFKEFDEETKMRAWTIINGRVVDSFRECALELLRVLKLMPRMTPLPNQKLLIDFCNLDVVFMGDECIIFQDVVQYFKAML